MFTKSEIQEQLQAMRAPRDKVVLVHSSLRAIGEVEGRGEGLLEALIEYFTAEGGLLCIPTHTWSFLGDTNKITLDLCDPQTCIGTLPNLAAKHPEAVRSFHPTHSMAVFGKDAESFAAGEEALVTPAHPNGCYGKIYDRDGYIFLAGVGHNRNTYLHCVEEMLGIQNRLSKEAKEASIRHLDGAIETRSIHSHEAIGIGDVSLRYPQYEAAFRYHNCITDGYLGNAAVQLCNARGMKDVMELINNRSHGADVLADEIPIDPALYITE